MGASKYPGRWNERNERAVYVTTNLPLGVLEVMVQDTITSLNGYGYYLVDIPDDIVLSRVTVATLSATWRTARVGRVECRAIGEAWRSRHGSVGLIVPSAVVPQAFDFDDCNIVLDPTHADFERLVIGAFVPLDVDDRIQALLATTLASKVRAGIAALNVDDLDFSPGFLIISARARPIRVSGTSRARLSRLVATRPMLRGSPSSSITSTACPWPLTGTNDKRVAKANWGRSVAFSATGLAYKNFRS